MVASVATSAFFPASSGPFSKTGANSSIETPKTVNFSPSSATSSQSTCVKSGIKAVSKVNGYAATAEPDEVAPLPTSSPAPRTFYNQLPDLSFWLAAITALILAAERHFTLPDWRQKRPDMLADAFGFGRIMQDGLVFKQNFLIRSYEIGADRTASIETLMNHLQVCIVSSLFGILDFCNLRWY
jgi:fatty acyl-ACP thioesterase B